MWWHFLITVLASWRTGAIMKAGPQRKAVSIPWVCWSEVNLVLKVRYAMLIRIFIELAEYFDITHCDKKSASSKHPSASPNIFPGWGKAAQRFRSYSSTYHTGADQNRHKMLELISFQRENNKLNFSPVGWDFIEGAKERERGQDQKREHRGITLCSRI